MSCRRQSILTKNTTSDDYDRGILVTERHLAQVGRRPLMRDSCIMWGGELAILPKVKVTWGGEEG